MTDTSTDIEQTADEQQRLRAEIDALVAADRSVNLTTLAKEFGIPYGTFTSWKGGSYAGDNARVAASVAKGLEARRDRARTSAVLPAAPGFQPTPTAQAILSILQFCHHAPDVGVIAGGAGIGKTTTLEEYKRRTPHVHMATAEPVTRAAHSILAELADAIGVVEKSPARLSKAIVQRLAGVGALVVIDEAQHLITEALDQLRTIADKAKCGLVICGNETVYARLAGEGRKAQFAQLFSRVGMRHTQARPLDGDVAALVSAWKIEGAGAIGLLRTIAGKPGALRGMTKALRLAHVVAAGEGEALAERHIRAAWAQLGAEALDRSEAR